jgi:hypothetical protein
MKSISKREGWWWVAPLALAGTGLFAGQWIVAANCYRIGRRLIAQSDPRLVPGPYHAEFLPWHVGLALASLLWIVIWVMYMWFNRRDRKRQFLGLPAAALYTLIAWLTSGGAYSCNPF